MEFIFEESESVYTVGVVLQSNCTVPDGDVISCGSVSPVANVIRPNAVAGARILFSPNLRVFTDTGSNGLINFTIYATNSAGLKTNLTGGLRDCTVSVN